MLKGLILKVSQGTIAKKLGLPQQAVSKALKGAQDISDKVRTQVIETAEEMGYRPNRLARSLIEGRSNVIGIIYPSFNGPYFLNMLKVIEQEASEQGYRLLVKQWGTSTEDDRFDIDYLLQYKVDGLIICPRSVLPWSERFYPEIVGGKVKVVTLSNRLPGLPWISSEDVEGAKSLVKHLISLGHREIAYVGLLSTYSSDNEKRVEGYRQALEEAGLAFKESNLLDNSKGEIMCEKRLRKVLHDNPEITAFVCFEDKSAITLIKKLRELGLSVPKDISVTGYGNNLLFPEEMKVPLTTVSQNEEEIGKIAIGSMLNMLKGKSASSIQVPTELIVRESTGKARKGRVNL
jgi:DNA-binding LacI/PurR family transcriptional regulator